MTQFVYGAIEIPAKLSMYYLLEKIGRRRTETGALFLTGITLMINIFTPNGETVMKRELRSDLLLIKRKTIVTFIVIIV